MGKGRSIQVEMRIIDNGKGGISLANKELEIFANVPVETKLYEQLMTLFKDKDDRFTWKEGEVSFIPKGQED